MSPTSRLPADPQTNVLKAAPSRSSYLRRMPMQVSYQFSADRGIESRMRAEASRRVIMTGYLIHARVVANLAGARSGRLYRVPGTKTTYRASAPGEYPAVRTGALRQSVRVVQDGPMRIHVGTNLHYGLYLDQSSGGGPGLRPWLHRSARECAADVSKIWNTPWRL